MEQVLLVNKTELQQLITEALNAANKSEPTANDEILDTADFQRIYGVSKVTQWKMRKAGKLPFHTLGRRIIYKKSEILNRIK